LHQQIAGRGLSSVIGVANEVLLRPIKAIHTWLWAQVAKVSLSTACTLLPAQSIASLYS